MKIAIDARLYGLEHAGIGRYVMNLVNELANIDQKNTYDVFLRKKYYYELDFPAKWRKRLVDVRHYTIKEQWTVNELLNQISPDIVHFPHFNVPIMYRRPFVVTIHDLSKHISKGKHSTTLPYLGYLIKRSGYSQVVKYAIQRSGKIIVPSEHVKKDILKNYAIEQSKIVVTYEGLNFQLNEDVRVVKKYKLKRPYFVFTGSAYPHKNLDRLVEAVVYLNEHLNKKAYLYISSSRSVFTERLQKLIDEKKAGKYITQLGFVSDEELASIYKYSTGFVYPSLMEGFGLPGLEAMACETISLVSDIPVFKEVYKNNALYFNPFDFTSIAQRMEEALSLKRIERRKKIASNKEFLKRYSWKKMAEETLSVYEQSSHSNESSASLR